MMIKNLIRLLFAAFGLYLIYISIFAPGQTYGMDSRLWPFLFGVGFIFFPFAAFAGLLSYFFMVGIPLALAFVGAYVGLELAGKGSILIIIGFLGGGFLGFKLVTSDAFGDVLDKFNNSVGALDDES